MSARRGPGRPSWLPGETLRRIVIAPFRGDSYLKIANDLNDDGVLIATGRMWKHSGIFQVVTSDRAAMPVKA